MINHIKFFHRNKKNVLDQNQINPHSLFSKTRLPLYRKKNDLKPGIFEHQIIILKFYK